MASEGEIAGYSIWYALSGVWKLLTGATVGIISLFTRRLVREIDENKTQLHKLELAHKDFERYVAEHYPDKKDFRELREEMRDGFRDIAIAVRDRK